MSNRGKMALTKAERAGFTANGELGSDTRGNEVLIGLDHDESNRHVRYVRGTARRKKEEAADALYLRDRHRRAMVFWKLALGLPECINKEMTAEGAFDVGRKAWNAYAGASQLSDFSEMIRAVPMTLRSAALNGWLNAFDDEAERLRCGGKKSN